MSKPRILITLDHSHVPSERLYINFTYLKQIENAGGIPVLAGRPDKDEIKTLVDYCDGIFLTGGDDVYPDLYGVDKNALCGKVDPSERDRVEWEILDYALTKKLPILGVCRGMQVMNVYKGGSLYQDIKGEMPGALKHDFHKNSAGENLKRNTIAHDMLIEEGTLLHDIVQKNNIHVNSLHHQGVRLLANSLTKCASTEDGLIEGVELKDHPFFIGVQWHPEELNDEPSRKLFKAFVDAAKKQ